jgi:histidinol-phosphate aminotransferase
MSFTTNNINTLVRDNIRTLKPYSSARNEYKGKQAVFLDANENPYESLYNRYPDPLQAELKQEISRIKGVASKNMFLGNGSDEAIDLLFRIFCEPGKDNVLSIDPSYGMYEVCADINNIELKKVLLTPDFQIDLNATINAIDANTKLLFLCSPNNPSGNMLEKQSIIELLESFQGIVVLDEAYIDFANSEGMVSDLERYPNLVIMQTFSKAWGLAGVRLGMAFAHEQIITYMNYVKYPYNINILTQKEVLKQLRSRSNVETQVNEIKSERTKLVHTIESNENIVKIFHSEANFILVKCKRSRELYEYLVERKVIVRDRSKQALCEDCLRITIGTPKENKALVEYIKEFYA